VGGAEVLLLREKVSRIYGFFLILVALGLLGRIAFLISTNELKINKITFENNYEFISKRFIENSLMLWTKPDFAYLKKNIWEMEPYVKNFKLEGNELILNLRAPFLVVKNCKNFFLISEDGVFLEKLKYEELLRINLPILNLDNNCQSFLERRIKDEEVIKFLKDLSKISKENFGLISEIDFEGMKVFLRKGIILKVNEWSNFIENSGIIDDVLKSQDKGTVIQLLSNGRLLILSEER
jgi:hypothetical protein